MESISGSRDLIYQVTKFLPKMDQVRFRLACKFWNHAISYSWKMQIIEIQHGIEHTIKSIPEQFDDKTLTMHYELVSTESCIKDDLLAYIKQANKGDVMFSNIRALSYFSCPHMLIQKPFFSVYLIIHNELPFFTKNTDLFDYKQLK